MPALRETFALDAAAAGLLPSAHLIGGMCALAIWTLAHRRAPARWLLAGSAVALSAGSMGLALAPAWRVTVAFAALIGLGFGGLAAALNSLFADGFGERSGLMINLLNGAYGVGAILAPLAISALPGADYRLPYGTLSVLALLIIPLLWATTDPDHESEDAIRRELRRDPRAARRILIGFGLVYLLYAGVEQGTGFWEATHLVSGGLTPSAAASSTALFFGAFTLARFAVAPIALRVPAERIFLGCIGLSIGFLLLAQQQQIAPVAYALVGAACGPVFPTGLNWLARSLPRMRSGAAVVLAGAGIGGAVFPPAVGGLIRLTDVRAIPLILAGVGATALLAALNLRRQIRARAPDVLQPQ